MIGLASDTERDFEQQGGFLETLANQVSVALTNARLYEMAQQELADRKRAEETLRESESRFRRFFQDSTIGMAVVMTDGRFTQVNGAFCEYLGYSEEELLGKTVQSITDPEDWEASSRVTPSGVDIGASYPSLRKTLPS